MNFPDADFNIAATNNDGKIYSELSTSVEAFFQGANNVFKGADVNFSNKKVVLREIGTANKHSYTNKMVDTSTVGRAHANVSVGDPIFGIHSAEFNINGSAAAVNTSQVLGLGSDAGSLDATITQLLIWQLTGLMYKILQ